MKDYHFGPQQNRKSASKVLVSQNVSSNIILVTDDQTTKIIIS